MSTTHLDGTVRAEIAASWRRSVSHGLVPDRLTVPYQAEVDGGRLERAARPVADQLSQDLAGTGVSLVLADERALIIDRRVPDRDMRPVFDRIPLAPGCHFGEESIGTNALGMALRQESPALVAGEEHFTDTLASLMCSAAPIIDPATGRMLGAVGFTTGAQADGVLMVPFARRAGREVEQRLVEGISAADRVLFEQFLRARRRAKGPLVSVNERIMHANTAAAGLTSAADRAPLWDWALRAMSAPAVADPVIRLTSGIDVTARARPVHDGDMLAGALVRLDPGPAPAAGPPRGEQAGEPAGLGWASLTRTERSVAGVVAQGATNREAAARLFLSPHTVDFHLRQIFRKLGIGSRVELARVVVEQVGLGAGRTGHAPPACRRRSTASSQTDQSWAATPTDLKMVTRCWTSLFTAPADRRLAISTRSSCRMLPSSSAATMSPASARAASSWSITTRPAWASSPGCISRMSSR
jgi:DNA-binding CsgD family transcriptional regulator